MLYEISKIIGHNITNSVGYLVGSHQYNLNNRDSDEDWTYIYFDPEDYLRVFKNFPEQKQLDNNNLKIYSLKSFAQILVRGNPNFVEITNLNPIFPTSIKTSTQKFPVSSTQSIITDFMNAVKPFLVTKNLAMAYNGHLKSVLAEIEKQDVTSKRLSHAFRLGYSLVELLETRMIPDFRKNKNHSFVLDIKNGLSDMVQCYDMLHDLQREIELMLSDVVLSNGEELVNFCNDFFIEMYVIKC